MEIGAKFGPLADSSTILRSNANKRIAHLSNLWGKSKKVSKLSISTTYAFKIHKHQFNFSIKSMIWTTNFRWRNDVKKKNPDKHGNRPLWCVSKLWAIFKEEDNCYWQLLFTVEKRHKKDIFSWSAVLNARLCFYRFIVSTLFSLLHFEIISWSFYMQVVLIHSKNLHSKMLKILKISFCSFRRMLRSFILTDCVACILLVSVCQ